MRALIVASIVCAVAASAGTATTRSDGLIAFTRYRLQDSPIWSEIWVARPDGSGARKISHSARAAEDDGSQWSPRGDWVAFDRCPGSGLCSVWLVHPDGSAQHRIAACGERGGCNDSGISFAPDGRHVVFVREWGVVRQGSVPDDDQIDHSTVVETDLDGGHLRTLLRADGYTGGFASPRFAPGGRALLYDQYGWNPARRVPDVLYVSSPDGSNRHRVTPARLPAGSGSWSPDGRTILFKPALPNVDELTPGTDLYSVAADGSHLVQLTHVGAYHYVLAGAFSPDGKSIVYATDAGAAPNPLGRTFADVFTLRLGAKHPLPVTRTANLDGWPSWGPAR